MDYLTGKLLIATPELADPNFFRTVSLIFHHTDEGAAGVVLNRPSNTCIGRVWEELDSKHEQQPIHVGGPVDGPLMALHTSLVFGESTILDGVLLSLTQQNLAQLVRQTKHDVKIFSGYAGWGIGQLESEIDAGGWLTLDCEPEDVFDTPEEIWKLACEKVGHEIMFSTSSLNLDSVDPLAN
jgi:putative transcriptional regulator